MAVAIAKIARFDVSKHWTALFPTLFSELQTVNPRNEIISDNTRLQVLRHLMKELSSKKLPNDRKMFSQISNNCFEQVCNLWQNFHSTFIEKLKSSPAPFDMNLLLEKYIHILKALKSMWIDVDLEKQTIFFTALLSNVKALLEALCAPTFQELPVNIREKYHKLLLTYSKIILDTEEGTLSKVARDIFTFARQCIIVSSQNKGLFTERFVVNCINGVKMIVDASSTEVVTPQDMEEVLRYPIVLFPFKNKQLF